MKVAIIQNKKEVAHKIKSEIIGAGFQLQEVAQKMDLTKVQFTRTLNARVIELETVIKIMEVVNPNIVVEFALTKDNEVILQFFNLINI